MTTAPRWEHHTSGSIAAITARGGQGVALRIEDGNWERLDENGARIEHGAGFIAHLPGESSLVCHDAGKASRIATGTGTIESCSVSGEHVALVRGGALELWTLADQRRWRVGGGPFVAAAVVGRTVAGLRADGEIAFFSAAKGAEMGTLKLGVPEPASTWQLATIDATRMALGVGEWLVIVEAASQKVLRRTRTRAAIACLAATERRVVAGLADGWLQAFDAFTSEPRGSVHADEECVVAIALAGTTVFSASRGGPIKAWDGATLETAARAAAPVTAVAANGAFVAAGDRSGRVRLSRGGDEVGNIRLDGSIGAVHVGRDESALIAAGSVLVKLRKPWKTPEPILLNAPASAFAADDAYAFAGTEQGTVDVYDLARGTQVTSYALTDAGITGLLRLPGAYLVVGTSALDGRLFVIDVAQAKVVHRIDAHQEAFGVTSLAADPRGRIVASGSDDGSIVLIEPNKGRVLARIRVPETPVSLAFEASGKKLAAVLVNGATLIAALDQKGALTKLELAPAMRVSWGDGLVVGFGDGRVERAAAPRASAASAPRNQ